MNFFKNRARFIIIIIFSAAVLTFAISKNDFIAQSTGRIPLVAELLKIFSGGYLIYGIVQCFRVK